MKKRIAPFKLLKRLGRNWKPEFTFILIFLLIAGWPAWQLYSAFSSHDGHPEEQAPTTADNALDNLAKLMNVDKGQLFRRGWPPVDSALYVNTRTRSLNFQIKPSSPFTAIYYDGEDALIKTPRASTQPAFDKLITTSFHLTDYPALLKDSAKPDTAKLWQIAATLGANPEYTTQIINTKKAKDIRTIVFSLLYNTILDGGEGHMLTQIANGKLKALTDKNYTVDHIDQPALAIAVDKLQSAIASDQVKFINHAYDSLHSNDTIRDAGNINSIFGQKTFQLGVTPPNPFLSINFKKDLLYLGHTTILYNPNTLVVDDKLAAAFFENSFHLSGLKGLGSDSLKLLAIDKGFASDTTTIQHAGTNAQTLFKTLLTYLLDHPSIYFVAGDHLTQLAPGTLDPRYGEFDTALLRTGLGNLDQAIRAIPDMTIVYQPAGLPASVYIALGFFFLMSVLLILLFYHHRRKIRTQQERLATLAQEIAELQEKQMGSAPLPQPQPKAKELPPPPPPGPDALEKLFQTIAAKKTETDKINSLLMEFDASKTAANSQGKLAGFFQELCADRENFGEVQKEHTRITQYLADFHARYKKLPDQKLLDRMALVCWTVELATDLIRIKEPGFEAFDLEKIKKDQLELIFSRYFFSIATQSDKTQADLTSKIADGTARIIESNTRLNDKISHLDVDDKTHLAWLESLDSLMKKIKSYDKTSHFFDRLYRHFAQEFIGRLQELRFTRTELNPDDRAWFFQHVLNIAFHAADYTEYYIKGDEEYYHPNVRLLLNDLDYSKDPPREFTEGDMQESSRAANAVAKAARFAGVRTLDFLVDKYYIKPAPSA